MELHIQLNIHVNLDLCIFTHEYAGHYLRGSGIRSIFLNLGLPRPCAYARSRNISSWSGSVGILPRAPTSIEGNIAPELEEYCPA